MQRNFAFAFISIFLVIALHSGPAYGSETVLVSQETFQHLLNEVKELKEANVSLKEELSSLKADQTSLRQQVAGNDGKVSAADDALSALEKELAAAISGEPPADGRDVKTTAQKSLGSAGVTNPDIGAVGIISYTGAKRGVANGG
ncbi:MAG TPA: hypothetical protein DCG57_10720, partial [Candidatus Riflebacteria bacterium]|nr:hypothetical protein [Candidatus Riflebacteria bacterium]